MSISQDDTHARCRPCNATPAPTGFCCAGGYRHFCQRVWSAIAETLGLSDRQLEIARGMLEGKGDKQIAAALDLSPNTIQTHVRRMYEKLGIETRTELVVLVFLAARAWHYELPPPTDCPQNS